jgi:hypothetical protein
VKKRLDRLRSLLTRGLPAAGANNPLGGLSCVACGAPAIGWSYVAHDSGEGRIIDGYATCAAHRSGESRQERTRERAG